MSRAVLVVLGAVLAVSACGKDERSKPSASQHAGAAGDGNAGEATSSGGSLAAGGESGDGGSTPGSAGSGKAGDPGTGGAGSEGISLDEFCTLTVRAREWLRECRYFFGDASGWWGTQNIEQFCSSGREAIEAGRLVYDPVQAAACAALSVGGCEDIEAFAFGVGQAQNGFLQGGVCAGVVAGAVALGDACHANSQLYASECAEGFCSTDACPGVCTAYSEATEPCDGSSTACDPATSYCNAQNECQLYPQLGEPCDLVQCAAGLSCWSDLDSSACVTLVAVGDTCDAAVDLCESGALCYQDECVTQVPLGEDCNSDQHCPLGAYCNQTCLQKVGVTGDCSGGQQCVTGAACVNGLCQNLGPLRGGCPCKEGLWCAGGTCLEPQPQGSRCVFENTQCTAPLVCVVIEESPNGPPELFCQPPGDVGGFCHPQYLGSCQVPLFCDPATNTCAAPAAEDEPCNFAFPLDSCQAGLYCSCTSACAPAFEAQASCKPRLANDADCTTAAQCLGGACTDLKCATPAACL